MEMKRRDFLKWATGVGMGATAVSLIPLGGCKKELVCTDTSGLTPEELTARTSLRYMDRSASNEKQCSGCQLFQPKGADECGGCVLVKGPIHPMGYCTAWAKKVG